MELTECVNFLLTTAQNNVFKIMKHNLSQFDVTPAQYAVLYCLWTEGATTPKEISERLKLEGSTVSGILERMERKELIVRHIDVDDRRYIQVELTEKGKSLEGPVLEVVEQTNQKIMNAFSEEKQEKIKDVLKKLAKV